jgi:UDP-N-acetylmuramate dehydrogenase
VTRGDSTTVVVSEQVMLAGYTTLGLGGPAARFLEAGRDDQVVAAVREADADGEPVLVLGGGSNLVVADEGFPGTVVHVATRGVQIGDDRDGVAVAVAAGEDWDSLVQRCVAEGLSGLECLSGIPGRAGATPIQNVGAYGQEVAETIVTVRAYDRLRDVVVELANADCGFGYRTSAFKRSADAGRGAGGGRVTGAGGGRVTGAGGVRADRAGRGAAMNPAAATGRFVVLGVTFRLTQDELSAPVRYAELAKALGVGEGERVPLADARAAVLALRRGKGMVLDPSDPDSRSAGSFFTNPILDPGQLVEVESRAEARSGHPVSVPRYPAPDGQVKISAAWLIEQAGFGRGYPPHGRVRISSKHTLALTNPGGADTASLIGLAREIKDGVRQAFGIDLVNEPVLVGAEL